jgi:PAS domain S-box-containing protein
VGLFLLQIFVAVGLTGWLSFRNGQQAVNDLVAQLQVETGYRVRDDLEAYLNAPHLVDDIHVSAVELNLLRLGDRDRTEAYLLEQLKNFPSVSYTALVSAEGNYTGVARLPDGSFTLDILGEDTNGNFEKWLLAQNGQRLELLQVRDDYEPTTRPWFRAAVEAGKSVWTDIYFYFGSQQPTISANRPFYDADGTLLGVASTDLTLWDMSQFFASSQVNPIGQLLAIDSQGRKVASSLPSPERLGPGLPNALDSEDALTQAAAELLRDRTDGSYQLSDPLRSQLQLHGERVFFYAIPLHDPRGIDWSVVVLMPASAFMEQIVANTRTTAWLCGVALLVATGSGLFVTQVITRPIARLSQASQTIARSASPPYPHCQQIRVACNTPLRIDELTVLANSFNQMAVQLHEAFVAWEQTNLDLERRVRDRTTSLSRAEEQLRALFATMTEFVGVKDTYGRYLKVASTHPVPPYNSIEDLEGKTDWELFPPQQAGQFVAYVREALQTGETVRVEYSLEHGSETVWFAASITPIRRRDEGEMPTAIWVARDITDRKRAEDAVREKEQYLRLILDNIPQQVFWKDTNLVFIGCNRNWALAAGLTSPEEVVGKTDYDLLNDPESAEEFRQADLQVIARDEPILHLVARKEKTTGEGNPVWLDINKIPIHDRYGNVMGILGVVEDITPRKLAEEALLLEQQKSEQLLRNVLPQAIVEQLKQNSESSVAEQFECATILFADIVGFTPFASRLAPLELVNFLNRIFSKFDRLAQEYGLEKIKTIGDAYMVAGGLPLPHPDRMAAIAEMALDMQHALRTFTTPWGDSLQIRIGIHDGPVVAGVIGIHKFTYDLWGDTVNVASRMESSGEPGRIQVTRSIYEALKHRYHFEERGIVFVKGKGEMSTYWLVGRHFALASGT